MNLIYTEFLKTEFYTKVKEISPNFSEDFFRGNNDIYLLTNKSLFIFEKTANKNIFLLFWKWYFRIATLGLSSFLPSFIKKQSIVEIKLNDFFISNIPKKHKEHVKEFISLLEKKEKQFELKKHEKEKELKDKNHQAKLEKKEKEKLEKINKQKCLLLLKDLDKDDNGVIDLVEADDFGKILDNNQKQINEINRDYIKSFVQVSEFLKLQRKSIQSIFNQLSEYINQGGEEIIINDELLKTFPYLNLVSSKKELILLKSQYKTDYQGKRAYTLDIIKWIEKNLDFSKTKARKYLDNCAPSRDIDANI